MSIYNSISTVAVAAANYDLLALTDVKDELSVRGADHDKRLARYISGASAAAAQFCNRVFLKETVKSEFWPARDPYPYLIRGGLEPLQLSRWPVAGGPSIAGIAPPLIPVLSQSAGGAIAVVSYFVRITYVTAAGETAVSDEATLSVKTNFLLNVASPAGDGAALATGWNVYVANTAGTETKQNVTPIAIGTVWVEPTGGLIAGAALPGFVSVIENAIPLCEGIDFRTDFVRGQLIRLDGNPYPKRWPAYAISVLFQTGYSFASLPADLTEAAMRMVKQRWFAKDRDSAIRQETVVGAYEAQYWFGAGPGVEGGMTPDVVDLLDNYRVPVLA